MTGLAGNGGRQSCRVWAEIAKHHNPLLQLCSVYGGKGRGGRMLVLLNPIYIVQYNIKACEICQDITTMSYVLQKPLKINV